MRLPFRPSLAPAVVLGLAVSVWLPASSARAESTASGHWKADAVLARGKASWYGPRFHGRRTASGETFDMHALTAAHPSLPFGTLVRVRNTVNGREVVVRINDRLPSRQRIIDLSRAAASSLGFVRAGLAPVVLIAH